jgi:hypothetical protein
VRLSDAEREGLFEQLKQHAAAGRLDVPQLERRVASLAQAQTREEAAELLSDLPPLPVPVVASGAARRARRRRGHGESEAPAPDWQPTSERFRDPRTRQVMRVWVDAAGGRHYVADAEA